MPVNFINHIGLAGGSVDNVKRAACNLANGDLYTYPLSTSTVDATQPVTFKWNTACPMQSKIDIYLYAPSSSSGMIQGWSGVDYSLGEYSVSLKPKWWNSTTTANLQVQILDSGAPTWMSNSPPGPVFKVNYDASAMVTTNTVNGQLQTSTRAIAVTDGATAVMQTVASNDSGKSGISKGAIAAAVVVPIIVIAIITGVAIHFWRSRETKKRRRWSNAVSTHSNLDWEKGALPGERMSRASTSMGRPSGQFSMGGRPGSMATSSVFAMENNMAGYGAGGNYGRGGQHNRAYSTDGMDVASRNSMVTSEGGVRQSRISFADVARPDRRSRLSLGDNLARPNIVGQLPAGSRSASDLHTPTKRAIYATGSAIADDDEPVNISPSQMHGPGAFADADVQRAGQGRRTGSRGILATPRRESSNSAVSADDFRSAASAHGSVDELRDMESKVLARRSTMTMNSPNPQNIQDDRVESLYQDPTPPLPQQPAPVATPNTVAYGPDQMLAVYAARGRVNGNNVPPVTPAGSFGGMKSFVHLNTGTASSAAVDALPAPGPVPTLGSPVGQENTTGRAE